jgi:hypothetical protein
MFTLSLRSIAVAALASTGLLLASAPAFAADAEKLHASDTERHVQGAGGPYFITVYHGFPGRREHAVHVTAQNLDDLEYARDDCTQQIRPQQPGIWKSEAVTIAEGTVAEAGAFAAEGAAVGVPMATIKTLAKEGAAAGVVSSAVNGFDSHNRAKRNHLGQCMINYVNDAVRAGDFPGGIHVIIDQDSAEGHKLTTSYNGAGYVGQVPAANQSDDQMRASH